MRLERKRGGVLLECVPVAFSFHRQLTTVFLACGRHTPLHHASFETSCLETAGQVKHLGRLVYLSGTNSNSEEVLFTASAKPKNRSLEECHKA